MAKSFSQQLAEGEESDFDSANRAALEQMRPAPTEESSEEDESEEEEPEAAVLPQDLEDEEPGKHKAKKRARGQRYAEIQAQLRERDQQLSEMQQRMAYLEGLSQQRSQEAPKTDPYEDKLKEIDEAYRKLYADYDKEEKPSEATVASYREKLQRLNDDRHRVLTAQTVSRMGVGQRPQNVQQEILRAKYADVLSNQRASQWAKGRLQTLMAEGHEDDAGGVLLDRVMLETRERFKIGKPPPKTSRSRLTGMSAGGSPGRVEGGSVQVDMRNPAFQKMAKAAYPDLPERRAYETWAKVVGPRLAKLESGAEA